MCYVACMNDAVMMQLTLNSGVKLICEGLRHDCDICMLRCVVDRCLLLSTMALQVRASYWLMSYRSELVTGFTGEGVPQRQPHRRSGLVNLSSEGAIP